MKPFALSLIRCTKCKSSSSFTLTFAEAYKLDEDLIGDNSKLISRYELDGKLLKPFEDREDLYSYKENDENSLNKALFGNIIKEGELICECGVIYPIKDEVLDTIDVIIK